jgi:hypothetical protein
MTSTVIEFTWPNITSSPDQPGVYALYKGASIIYIGQSESSIRARLNSHKSGREGSGTSTATHFWYEVCSRPSEREKELLQWFKNENGHLPSCNEIMP